MDELAWLIFVASGAVVALAGARLARDGDTIAEGTGLGGAWVGVILVAGSTSLPELSTNVSAVLQGHPELAVGDLFGANMTNLLVLAVADLLTRHTRVLTRVTVNQALVGTLAISLSAVAALGIVVGDLAVFGVGIPSLAIAFAYAAGMVLLHRNRGEPPFRTPAEVAAARPRAREVRRAFARFAAAALVILMVAPALAASAATLADRLGISEGLAGMVLLAFATTLPETAVSFTSVRAGSYDLAVGNLFGSTCFNLALLFPLDLVHRGGSLLAAVPPSLVVAPLVGITLMSLAVLDVLNKAERRLWLVEPGPAIIALLYLAGLWVTYRVHG
jgi:cation:H+ antiporter